MSILITGIDMPKKHGYIDITIFGDGETYYEYNTIDSGEYQTTSVQLDRPHGRLIDVDKLKEAIRTDIMGGLNYERFMNNAPTILEAEGEE